MRQRGAGTRDISLAFDLELPGIAKISKTPLRAQKFSRTRKTPQREPLPLQSTRKSPKTTTSASTLLPAEAAKDHVQDSGGIQRVAEHSKKRKAVTESSENATITFPKKRRRRKSDKQLFSKRKSQPSTAPQNIIELSESSSKLRKARIIESDMKGTTEDVSKDIAMELPVPGDLCGVTAKKEAQTTPKPRKKKAASVVKQPLRRKKPPAAVEGLPQKEAELPEEVPNPNEDPSEKGAAETQSNAKPGKRKRITIALSSKKRKKPSPSQKALVSKEPEGRPESPIQELGLDPTTVTTIVEPKPVRRGRKPRVAPKDHSIQSEAVIESRPEVLKPSETPVDQPLAEDQPRPTEDPQAPKQKSRKKRKSIVQGPKPRKRKVAESAENVDSGAVIIQPEVATINQEEKPPALLEMKRRGRWKKLPVSLTEPPKEEVISEQGQAPVLQVPPLQVPKKRGRPKKAAPSASVTIHDEATDRPIERNETDKPRRGRTAKRPTVSASFTAPVPLPQETEDQLALQEPEPSAPANVKKRGRPKKQGPVAPKDEMNLVISETKPFESKSKRSFARTKPSTTKSTEASGEINPEKPVQPKTRAEHSTARTKCATINNTGALTVPNLEKPQVPTRNTPLEILDDDDYDDPLSDL
ncbi:MAG: hypothetical protein Q9170_006879, partial [Blastenia crenularia]